MLRIGEFAALTGLSVKALRHYDETGVLVPAEIDGRSAYRRYAKRQVRSGLVIRALRDAGVPLPAVSAAIASGGSEKPWITTAAASLNTGSVRTMRFARPEVSCEL